MEFINSDEISRWAWISGDGVFSADGQRIETTVDSLAAGLTWNGLGRYLGSVGFVRSP